MTVLLVWLPKSYGGDPIYNTMAHYWKFMLLHRCAVLPKTLFCIVLYQVSIESSFQLQGWMVRGAMAGW